MRSLAWCVVLVSSFAMVGCGDDDDGAAAGAGGTGATSGSAGSAGSTAGTSAGASGTAGSTAGAAGTTAGAAGTTAGAAGTTAGAAGTTAGTAGTSAGSAGTAGASGSAGAPACGLTWDDRADCETCMEDSCCNELEECDPNGTSPCGTLTKCIIACDATDTSCAQGCYDADTTAGGNGATALQAVFTCYDTNCQTQQACEYPICDSGLLYPDMDCATCLGGMGSAGCCAQLDACKDDTTCNACLATPDGAGCSTNQLFQAAQTCQDTTCGPVCASAICGSTLGYTNHASCNYCLSQHCCDSFEACTSDTTCNDCLTGAGTGCDTNAKFTAFTTCRDTAGAMTCGDAGECK